MESTDKITELPVGWTMTSLSQCCDKVQDGSHFSPQTQYTEAGEGRYLYITAKNIKEYGIDLSDVTWVDRDFHESIYNRCNPEQGDVLLIKDGVKTGIATVNQLENPFSLLSSVALLKAKKNFLNPHFLKHYLNSPTGFKATTGAMTGTAIRRIILAKLKTSSMPIPPLPEQHRIVNKIEELFTKLDAGVDELRKAKARLRRHRKAVLAHAFRGNLTKEWRRVNSTLPAIELLNRIKNERETVYQHHLEEWQRKVRKWEKQGDGARKPAKPRRVHQVLPPSAADLDGLPQLPKGWCWEKLGNIVADLCLGKMLDKEKNRGEYQPYLRNINVRWLGFDLSELLEMRFEPYEHERYGIVKGDLIVCEGGEPGRAAIWESALPSMMIQKALHRVRFFENLFNTHYVLYYLWHSSLNGYLEQFFTGTTIKHLTGEGLEDVTIPVAPVEEQQQIVEVIEDKLSAIKNLEEEIERSLKRSQYLRQSVLRKAFSGTLVEQHPSDEPADKLLERISQSTSKPNLSRRRRKSDGVTSNGK